MLSLSDDSSRWTPEQLLPCTPHMRRSCRTFAKSGWADLLNGFRQSTLRHGIATRGGAHRISVLLLGASTWRSRPRCLESEAIACVDIQDPDLAFTHDKQQVISVLVRFCRLQKDAALCFYRNTFSFGGCRDWPQGQEFATNCANASSRNSRNCAFLMSGCPGAQTLTSSATSNIAGASSPRSRCPRKLSATFRALSVLIFRSLARTVGLIRMKPHQASSGKRKCENSGSPARRRDRQFTRAAPLDVRIVKAANELATTALLFVVEQ
jgi:hypothetical protein